MNVEKNLQRNAGVNLGLSLVVTATTYAVAYSTHSFAGQVAGIFLWLGFLVGLVSWFHMRLEERERLESLELDELARSRGSGTLFTAGEGDSRQARGARELFERYFVPGFTLVLLLMQAVAGWWCLRWLSRVKEPPALAQPLVAMAILGLFALVLYLIGQFSSRLARLEQSRLLQPSASYVLLGAHVLALAVAGLALVLAGFSQVDYFLAQVFCGLLWLLALENLFSLMFEFYRPRVKGRPIRILYDSRLVGLISHPESVFTTVAHTLDYQFGFKVSETWFYQFLKRSMAWLTLSYLAILTASTCLVYVQPGEEALLERFGKPAPGREVLGPGFHAKLPWPIDQAYRYRTQEIQTFDVGFEHDEKDEHEAAVLWTVSHYKEELNLLVASRETAEIPAAPGSPGRKAPPVSLLSVGLPVQYQIHDLKAWAYNYSNAGELLKELATREVVRYLVGVDVNDIMSVGRFAAAEELQKRIQARADELKLGVRILFVGLQDVHPPVRVGAAYEKFVGAKQKREADILKAQAYAIRTNSLAIAAATTRRLRAAAESARRVTTAAATESLFTNQMAAYRASPDVYSERARLQTLSRYGQNARKIVRPATNAQETLQLNLEEKLREGVMAVPLPPLSPGK
ncbi:MAG TPA: protease modulator HflK [Verrucomicrobiae bacterium]|nr:protease modulator HflK [Verrucomicrobiae bacterium]